jgi:proline iminopeptidase
MTSTSSPTAAGAVESRRTQRRSAVRTSVGALLFLAAIVTAPAVAAVAALATAAVSASLPVLLLAGLGAALVSAYLLGRGGARVLRRRRSGRVAAATAAVSAALTGVLAVVTVLAPGGRQGEPLPLREPTGRWQLSTGSTIAYDKVPALGRARSTPVVLLHGGPGTPGSGTGRLGDAIAARGFDVYSYDQIGAGRSARLSDPTGYSVSRNVADLEAVRQTIGAERLVLVGTSWGATLAAEYLAARPERVAGVVFVSPGALWAPAWTGTEEGDIWDRLPPAMDRRVDTLTSSTRLTALGLLMQVNPRAAHALVGDAEVDGLFTEVLRTVAAAGTCNPTQSLRYEGGRPGFYANQLVSADQLERPDPRPALRAVRTPALVLRGECDYKRPEIAAEYAATIPGAVLREIADAGHLIRVDQPAAYESAVLRFLEPLR